MGEPTAGAVVAWDSWQPRPLTPDALSEGAERREKRAEEAGCGGPGFGLSEVPIGQAGGDRPPECEQVFEESMA